MNVKILVVAAFLVGMMAISGCDNFLDTVPVDSMAPVNYYNTQSDLDRALAGVYDRLGDNRVYGEQMFTNFAFSDEFFRRGATTGFNANIFDASQLEVNRNWETLYTGIGRANLLLENIDKANVSQDVKNEIRGQALFMRAYYYFILADMYGDVPLKLESTKSPTEPPMQRTSVREVFNQIVADMKEASGLVKPITSYGFSGRVTKTVAHGILARVYLKMAGYPLNDVEKFADARAHADSVISSGIHSLNPDYSEIFINHSKDLYDIKESMWEVEFWGNNSSATPEAGKVGVINGISSSDLNIGYVTDNIRTTQKLYDSYDAEDLRRDWNIAPYRWVTSGTTTNKVFWSDTQIYDRNSGKWRRDYETFLPKARDHGPTNFPLLRYADVLLMYAEAENEINGPANAYEYVNQVRRRGYGKPVNTPDPTVDLPVGLDKELFRKAIQKERFLEFAFEGMRKHDLIRWGIYIDTMDKLAADITDLAPAAYKYAATIANNTTERNVLLPIPNSEIAVNPYVSQNPNW